MASTEEMSDYEKAQQPWTFLETKEEIDEKIKQNKDKAVVIVFNLSQVRRDDVEYLIKPQRHKCDSAVFFKSTVVDKTDPVPVAFNIKQVPTILIYHPGQEPLRLVKPTREQVLTELDTLKEQKKT